MGTYYKYPPELLARIAAESRSVNEMLRKLNVPILGGSHTHISRQLKRFGIDTSHFTHLGMSTARRSYTQEILADAAASSRSLREMLERLGSPSYPRAAHHILSRCRHFGIDLEHFEDAKRARHRDIDPDTLRSAVAKVQSIAEITRMLGIPTGGTGYRLVHRCAGLHGIDLTGLPGEAHNKGKRSPHRHTPEQILRLEPERNRRVDVSKLRRALDELGRVRECTACGIGIEWRGRKLILEVDHINGNWRDNRAENLRYLCPNCHSQTDSFCGRNRGIS